MKNYSPGNFVQIDDPAAVGRHVTAEHSKISNSIGLANEQITTDGKNIATNTTNIATINTTLGTLGTAATKNVGTAVGNVVQLDVSTGKLPAVDGSLLTNLPVFDPHEIKNSLGADVLLNNVANYFDGPSVAQGSTGTWFVSGSVTIYDTAAAANFHVKLWDGTTVIDSGYFTSAGASFGCIAPLSGFLATPAGNLRISVKDITSTNGKIIFNQTGNSKDSTITAFRIK